MLNTMCQTLPSDLPCTHHIAALHPKVLVAPNEHPPVSTSQRIVSKQEGH